MKIDKESRKVVEDVIDEDEVPAVFFVFLVIRRTHVLCTCYDAQTCLAVVCHSMVI